MSAIGYVLTGIVLGGLALVGAFYWLVRRPTDRGEVSTQWRDERLRGRRD